MLDAKGDELNTLRQRIQMVFQDPVSSLSPRMTVRNIISEPLEIHQRGDARSRLDAVRRLLNAIGLPDNAMSAIPQLFRWAAAAYRHCTGACARARSDDLR